FSLESDYESLPPSSLSDRLQPSGGYHAVPPPITGTFMPLKPDLVFHTSPIAVETDHSAFTVQLSPSKLAQDLSHTTRPLAPIIEDWVFDSKDEYEINDPQSVPRSVYHLIKDCDFHAKKKAQLKPRNCAHMVLTQSKPVSITAVRPVSAAVPKIMVSPPRHAHSIVRKSKSPIRRHITWSPSPKTSNSPPRVIAAQAPVVSAAKGKKGKWVWRPKCPILDHDSKTTSASMTLKRVDYNDALGRSKSSNDVTRLQAPVNKKKVVITEAAIRDVLRLDDAEGVDCLPNEEIFAELARRGYEKPSIMLTFYKAFFSSQWKFLIHTILQSMSAKRTSWNEFSSAMASAIAMLTMRARRFLQKIGRNLGDNRVTSMGFDMSKLECYNCHRKGHFARECRSPKDLRRTDATSYQAEEEPANFAFMAITSSSSSSDNE
nr:ribonuclease H-like domain-containing protein [Tanacetum cinerariifolium]